MKKPAGQDGFILVATLWFVALLALASVIIEGWIASSLERGAAFDARVAANSARLSAAERVFFTLVSSGSSARGIELVPLDPASSPEQAPAAAAAATAPTGPFVALDERPYRVGNVVLRLQDGAGLFDLNSANRDTLDKLLKTYGATSADSESLASALLDYVGKPADIRASGIRDADYARAALPLPRHAPLLTPWELMRVLNWASVKGLWQGSPAFPEIATLGPISGLNVNTAPAKVLAALLAIDEREAARIVLSRTVRPITDLRDIQAATGSYSNEDRPAGFSPANIIRLKMTDQGEPLMRVMEIRLTPLGKAPYRIDYTIDMPRNAATPAIDIALLPDLPSAPAPR